MKPYLITSIDPPLPPPTCWWSWHENGFKVKQYRSGAYHVIDVVNDRSMIWQSSGRPDFCRLHDKVYIRGDFSSYVWDEKGWRHIGESWMVYLLYGQELNGYFYIGKKRHSYHFLDGGRTLTYTTCWGELHKKQLIKVTEPQTFQVFKYLGEGRFVTENNNRQLVYYDIWYDEKRTLAHITLPLCIRRHILSFIIPDES
jgi:hypothetical protein